MSSYPDHPGSPASLFFIPHLKSVLFSAGPIFLVKYSGRLTHASQLRELISLARAATNNPEVILVGRRKHPEKIRRQGSDF